MCRFRVTSQTKFDIQFWAKKLCLPIWLHQKSAMIIKHRAAASAADSSCNVPPTNQPIRLLRVSISEWWKSQHSLVCLKRRTYGTNYNRTISNVPFHWLPLHGNEVIGQHEIHINPTNINIDVTGTHRNKTTHIHTFLARTESLYSTRVV